VSDIVQGALIGIAGAIVGAIIAAVSSYIIAKSQINARRDELNQQLSHQEHEIRIHRLIEARKEHLFQLRRTISDYIENMRQETNLSFRFINRIKNKDKSLSDRQETQEFFGAMEKGKQLYSQLETIRGQLSDNQLDDLINTFLEKYNEIEKARLPIVDFLTNPQSTSDPNTEYFLKQEKLLRDAQRKEIIKINKRIEDLLSGE